MPLQERVGLKEEHDLTEPRPCAVRQPRQFAGEDEQGEFLPAGNARRTGLFPLQDAQLLAEEQDLQILVMFNAMP